MPPKRFPWLVTALAVAALWPVGVSATPITYSKTSGDRSASVVFDTSGSDLLVTLTNTSTADVLNPGDVLTAVFFDIAGDPTLAATSAVLATGSSVWFGSTDPGGSLGGEWAYASGLSGAPYGASQGISSSGLGLFAPSDLFGGTNLQGPVDPDGLQYGITSLGDNPTTGNKAVTGTNALIYYSMVFTLSGLPGNFSLDSIDNVSFQYGTSLKDTNLPVPEPNTLALLAMGLGVAGFLIRRQQGTAL